MKRAYEIRGELRIRVTPRSNHNRIETSDNLIKVWVTASPTDGQANDAVCRLVANQLDLPPSAVTVFRGHTSRDKALSIVGMDTAMALARIKSG